MNTAVAAKPNLVEDPAAKLKIGKLLYSASRYHDTPFDHATNEGLRMTEESAKARFRAGEITGHVRVEIRSNGVLLTDNGPVEKEVITVAIHEAVNK